MLVDTAKKSATDPLKITSKRAIQKAAEATGNQVSNKIADKITSFQKKTASEIPAKKKQKQLAMKYQKKYICLHKKDRKLLMN